MYFSSTGYVLFPTQNAWQAANVEQLFHLLFGSPLWNLIEADCCRNALISLLCHSPLGRCSWVSPSVQHWGEIWDVPGIVCVTEGECIDLDSSFGSVCVCTQWLYVSVLLPYSDAKGWFEYVMVACSSVSRCHIITHNVIPSSNCLEETFPFDVWMHIWHASLWLV